MKLFSLVSTLIIGLTTAASAASSGEDYGAAGCGLGSIVMGKDGKFTQVLAATTNGTFGSQTFGITSGTSNCEKGGKLGALKVKEFAASNRSQLESEAARGSGETLSTLASLMNCKSEATVASNLKTHFGDVFTSASNDQVGADVVASLSKDPQVQAACQM